MYDKISKVLNKIENVLNFFAGASITLMMALITLDTLMRYIIKKPISGVQEIVAAYLSVILVYLSISYCYRVGGHVRVDALRNVLPKAVVRIIDIVAGLAVVVFFVIMIDTTWTTMLLAYKKGTTPGGVVNTPVWPSYLLLIIGVALIALRVLLHTGTVILGVKDPYNHLDEDSITVSDAEKDGEKSQKQGKEK